MTPGVYLRLCRERAGLSIDDVALMISERASERDYHAGAIGMIERDLWDIAPAFATMLREAFTFDRFVLRQLICRLEPVPEICRGCGCSALDACDDEDAGPCAWATTSHDLCTGCAGDPARANLEEMRHA